MALPPILITLLVAYMPNATSGIALGTVAIAIVNARRNDGLAMESRTIRPLAPRSSGRVRNKVPSSYSRARAAQLNR